MSQELFTALESSLVGAKASLAEDVPVFPSSYDIENTLKKIGFLAYNRVVSQESALASAVGSEISNKRTFLMFLDEANRKDIDSMSFMRLPVVGVTFSTDLNVFRDSNWIVFAAENNQEIIDSVIQAYKICEDKKVLLPAVISCEMHNFGENVTVPSEKTIANFMPKLNLPHSLDVKKDNALGVTVEDDAEFRMQQINALSNSKDVMKAVNEKWKKMFKRQYDSIDSIDTEDAEYVFVVSGMHSSTVKSAVKKLRVSGKKIGVIRVRVLNPFPAEEIKESLKTAQKVAVIDTSMAGTKGVLYREVEALFSNCYNFILSKHLNEKDVVDMSGVLEKGDKKLYWVA